MKKWSRKSGVGWISDRGWLAGLVWHFGPVCISLREKGGEDGCECKFKCDDCILSYHPRSTL